MLTRPSISQSPTRKCRTPSQNYQCYERTIRANPKPYNKTNSRYQGIQTPLSFDKAFLRNFTALGGTGQPKRQQSKPVQTRQLKTEMYNDHLTLQGGRVVHSRNEGVSNNRAISLNYKKQNLRQQTHPVTTTIQKKTRSSSQTVDKENFYTSNAEKKRSLHTNNPSLNSSFNQSRNITLQQSGTPNPSITKGSLHSWANQHQISLNTSKSTRKQSLQGRHHQSDNSQQSNFLVLDSNQFAYNVSSDIQVLPQTVARHIKICYKLIEEQKYNEALKCLSEIENEQLTPAQAKDVIYLKGLILMTFKKYDLAIAQFTRLLQKFPSEKNELIGQVSLLTAVAYKKINNAKDAIGVLTQFLNKKVNCDLNVYYDALIYRGKLYLKTKDFTDAVTDFQLALSLTNEDKQFQGRLGKADTLRLTGRKQEALIIYNGLLNINEVQGDLKRQVSLRKVLTLIEVNKHNQALEQLDDLLSFDPTNSEALYYKGIIQIKIGQQSDAILSFEQAIKQNNSRKGVTKSILEISKAKIDQRDYYAAYYTLQRAQYLDVDEEAISKMTSFTEGVVFLMKRKFQDGVGNLTQLINNHQLGDFLRSLVFVYRAYGYICLSKYQKALNDLNYISNIYQLESGANYNKIICEGILLAQQNLFEKSIQTFQKAATLFPGRMEPHFYKSMTLMKFVHKHLQKDEFKAKYIKNALQHLDQAISLSDQNSNLLYHRGLIRFYFERTDEALQDFNKAIEKSEENIGKFFYVRGLAYACIKNEKQALSDFTIVINLDGRNADAYLNRAKVFQMIGDKNSAFNDLQKYISFKPHDPEIHLWAGNLLFNIGAYDNAVKAYSHSNEINSSSQLLQLRAQCYIILKELNSALADLSKIIDMTGDQRVYIDREALQSLKTASMGPDEPQQLIIKQMKPKKLAEGFQNQRLASQMLKKLISLNIDGIVFQISDLYFYRGVNKFFLRNYEKAIENWTVAYTIKQESAQKIKDQDMRNNNSEDEFCKIIEDTISKESISNRGSLNKELEELEFENRSFTMYEFYFNIAIAYLMVDFLNFNLIQQQEKFKKCNEILVSLKDSIQEVEYQTNLSVLIAYIEKEVLFRSEKQQPNKQVKQSSPVLLTVFPTHNRLCCIFPSVNLPFKHTNNEIKLSFCLPKIDPPSMHPEFDQKLLECLSPEVVENKPEAPWIKRNQDGVVFTDNVQLINDLDLKSESQRSENDKSNKNGQKNKQLTLPDDEDDYNEQILVLQINLKRSEISANEDVIVVNRSSIRSQNEQQSSGEIDNKKLNIQKLKQQLQLDARVQKKLSKLKN